MASKSTFQFQELSSQKVIPRFLINLHLHSGYKALYIIPIFYAQIIYQLHPESNKRQDQFTALAIFMMHLLLLRTMCRLILIRNIKNSSFNYTVAINPAKLS